MHLSAVLGEAVALDDVVVLGQVLESESPTVLVSVSVLLRGVRTNKLYCH